MWTTVLFDKISLLYREGSCYSLLALVVAVAVAIEDVVQTAVVSQGKPALHGQDTWNVSSLKCSSYSQSRMSSRLWLYPKATLSLSKTPSQTPGKKSRILKQIW